MKNRHTCMCTRFLLLISSYCFGLGFSQSVDTAAIRALSRSLNGADTLSWSGSNICNWDGITCSPDQRVTKIQIGNTNLQGRSLPSDIRSLASLQQLELQNCSLTGPLPSLRGMPNLRTLLLHRNNFTSISDDIFDDLPSLENVYLYDNSNLAPWVLPQGLRNASLLRNFSAGTANVYGEIPDFVGDSFPSLELLDLSYNNLSGSLPATFTGSGLKSIWLNNQQGSKLSGPLTVIQNMTNLVTAWLHVNAFTGPLPDFSQLTSLNDLEIRDNRLTGIVPDSLIKLTSGSLKRVYLKNNLLQGPLPVLDTTDADVSKPVNRFCRSVPGQCDTRVTALLSILEPLNYPSVFASDWQGNNPCTEWVGISCEQGNITVVNFQRMGLSGTISPSFSLLTSLKRLILADNNLTGQVPPEIANLTNLRELDVSNNKLTGSIPKFRNTVTLKTSGNPWGAVTPSNSPSSGTSGTSTSNGTASTDDKNTNGSEVSTGIIVGSVLAAVGFLLLMVVLGFFIYKRKKDPFKNAQGPSTVIHPRHSGSDQDFVKITVAGSNLNPTSSGDSFNLDSKKANDFPIESGNMIISIQILREVTNNFGDENILGRGGFGTVYKGELPDGTKIAVKRMESGVLSAKGLDEFKAEIAVLTKVRHRHLVNLQGYCLEDNERILVYEYMPQGTLSRHLFNWREEGLRPLEWKKRLGLALDVAKGVEYLHSLAHQSFIHRDLKPSNILLGDDMKAKVSDFGLVRLAPSGKDGKNLSVVTRLAGTFGYLAPEYAATGRVTTKVDVFSFGVILMELITGRKVIEESMPEETMYLVPWFRRMLINKEKFQQVIDPTLDLTEDTISSILTVAELAGHCCAREPLQRPDMGHVVNVLASLVDVWKPSEPDAEDMFAIDLDRPLSEVVQKWVENEGTSFVPGIDNTQTSIPSRPFESFTSTDAR